MKQLCINSYFTVYNICLENKNIFCTYFNFNINFKVHLMLKIYCGTLRTDLITIKHNNKQRNFYCNDQLHFNIIIPKIILIKYIVHIPSEK